MREVSIIYIDDSTSRYLYKALNSLLVGYKEAVYSIKCERFDWNSANPNELDRLFGVIEEKDTSFFFIDSALFNADATNNSRFLGIWVAYTIRANIPRAHIAIVSSMHNQESSFAKPEYAFLEKLTKDSDEEKVLQSYKETISSWIEEDFVFNKSCDEFDDSTTTLNKEIRDKINFSLARMNSKEDLSKEDFKEIISLLKNRIDNEE